jgi:NAD(P)H-dependent FMN reductase
MMGTDVTQRPLRVAVIIGSTREGRAGDRIGDWIAGQVSRRSDLEPNIVDLADFDFPSRYPRLPTPPILRFTELVGRAEAFVVVTPEYNRSFPASLKQAIDFAYDEWRAKPVGFVSYGCRSDGRYAVDHLRAVFTEMHAVSMRDGVGLDLLAGGCDPAAPPADAEVEQVVTAMLDQLLWWGLALRDARALRPYAS